MAKGYESEPRTVNLICANTEIKGEIISSGDFRIDGTLKGSINTKGKVIIGSTGKVQGEIKCQNADFSGVVEATVHVFELLLLKASANLTGDIIVNKIAIEPGAKFSGSCSMDNQALKTGKILDPKNEETKQKGTA